MLMVETQEMIADLKQGERSMMDYVAELHRCGLIYITMILLG